MKDLEWGQRDARGEWQPETRPAPNPLLTWPLDPKAILRSIFGFGGLFWPYNAAYAAIAVVSWLFFTPSMETTSTFRPDWIAGLFLRNAILLALVAGGLHLRLYATKGQGTKFKYSDKWLAKNDSRFLFRSQVADNVFWNLTSGCIVWTGYEAATLWAYSHKLIPYVSWTEHPVWCAVLMILVLYLRQLHFYWVHRLMHWKPLYRVSHYLHHKNINIGPWSGMSMHPIEHIIYLSGVLLHWVIPSNPLHAIFYLQHACLSPALGHAGFEKLVSREERGFQSHHYFHYLHHRYFTVNYGVEIVPLDWWFGSAHDGSPEAQAAMLARRKKSGVEETSETG